MISHGNNYDDEDIVTTIPPSESPVIVPLMVDQLRPRRGVTFDILASDFSADCKTQFDWITGKRKTMAKIPNRSPTYRRARQEFLCFICLYGFGGIVALVFATVMLMDAIFSEKWGWEEHHHLHQTEDLSAYKAKNAKQAIKYFLYSDMGADDD